ncbi:MAG: M23 family metallopeptidase, partial [Longimicrobiales bacterium]|nr:M23 family metallopeptidase [Longimicrobiales bacterium]
VAFADGQPVLHAFYPGRSVADSQVDYTCGPKARHDGASEIVAAFYSYLDSTIAVVAAAPGTITEIRDGEPDRRNTIRGPEGLGNFVRISHTDGYETSYGFLRNGSIVVSPGDVVEAGSTIGSLGSSGEALLPSVRFEVLRDGESVDPFAGECGSDRSYWFEQPPYEDEYTFLASGLTNESVSLAEMREPVASVDSISDGVAFFWVYAANVPGRMRHVLSLRDPDGLLIQQTQFSTGKWLNISLVSASFLVSDMRRLSRNGTWTWSYSGASEATKTFELIDPLAAAARAPEVQPASEPVVVEWGLGQAGRIVRRLIR